MMPSEPVLISRSIVRVLALFFLSNILLIGSVFLMFGASQLFLLVYGLAGAITFVFTLLSIARIRPQLEITDDGFTLRVVLGERSYRWVDIDGEFETRRIGILTQIVFRLTAEYKSTHKTGRSPSSGYDAAVSSAFEMPIDEIAALLNERKKVFSRDRRDQDGLWPDEAFPRHDWRTDQGNCLTNSRANSAPRVITDLAKPNRLRQPFVRVRRAVPAGLNGDGLTTFLAHLGAILVHTLIVRDGILNRMAPWNVRPPVFEKTPNERK
jgi:hypothetical protein